MKLYHKLIMFRVIIATSKDLKVITIKKGMLDTTEIKEDIKRDIKVSPVIMVNITKAKPVKKNPG